MIWIVWIIWILTWVLNKGGITDLNYLNSRAHLRIQIIQIIEIPDLNYFSSRAQFENSNNSNISNNSNQGFQFQLFEFSNGPVNWNNSNQWFQMAQVFGSKVKGGKVDWLPVDGDSRTGALAWFPIGLSLLIVIVDSSPWRASGAQGWHCEGVG